VKLLAIDPGLTGGLAIFDDERLVAIDKMPLWKPRLMPGSTAKPQVDLVALRKILAQHDIDLVVTEYQTAMPGQSSVATATSFLNWGLVLALRVDAPVHVVHPRVWKNHLGLVKDKKMAVAKAHQLFPALGTYVHHGVAEAILIGHYWLTAGAANERTRLEIGRRRDEKRALAKALKKGRRGQRHAAHRAAAAKPARQPAA
jgi:hypothetical protein